MYALNDFYSFIFSGVPSICVSHIYRTLNKRKSPCDMIATNELIAACSSHWIVINNNERPIIATCSSQWIVIDNLWIWPMNICVIWRLIKLLWSMTQLNVHATQRKLMVVISATGMVMNSYTLYPESSQKEANSQLREFLNLLLYICDTYFILTNIYLTLKYFNLIFCVIYWFPHGIWVITKFWVGKCNRSNNFKFSSYYM